MAKTKKETQAKTIGQAPSFLRVMWKEIKADKVALISLILMVLIVGFVFIAALTIDQEQSKLVNFKLINKAPSREFILGTTAGGQSVYEQLILGARNSFLITLMITGLTGIVGIFMGLVAGYYGGRVDNIICRIIDFFLMIPYLMLIIVLVSLIPTYNVVTFVLIVSSLAWMGKARLVRAKTLQQSSLDYVSAAKTLGTPNWAIMLKQVLPNISSIIVVNLTLNLAANMAVEVSLTFLGFGLPFGTPSLGSLLTVAKVPENITNRYWQWLPAALLFIVMMLLINFVGQAINRAADAKQRVA